ncbi:unnamed protein product [Cylicocyclus nassatus]|uniref:Uncharacterized protein n=1 Tax=Cylicocyclus nassatus TaxID=53992 RepID=A0AA36HCU4_CYLNA|nr:unnamed protein product [Cylicocyclus nassatus]
MRQLTFNLALTLFTVAMCNPIVNVNIEDKCCDGFDMKKIADVVCNSNCACTNDQRQQTMLEFCQAHGHTIPCAGTGRSQPVV